MKIEVFNEILDDFPNKNLSPKVEKFVNEFKKKNNLIGGKKLVKKEWADPREKRPKREVKFMYAKETFFRTDEEWEKFYEELGKHPMYSNCYEKNNNSGEEKNKTLHSKNKRIFRKK